jgi:ubiquinol-cytochrome c reductase cytochrome c1 subunit
MKKLVWMLSLFTLLSTSVVVNAAGGYKIELEPTNNNLQDKDSLQRGAVHFANYCMACHSVKYMRYNRVAQDLGWSNEEVVEKMSYGQNKAVDIIETRMLPDIGLTVLGAAPPDLSLMARLKGTDYIYTFLRSYYQDDKGNWNNHALPGTSMPNVLESLQRQMSAEEYAQTTRDIANFMEYVGEPAKLKRLDLGWKVIVFLLFLLLLTYLLKREYWRDIKH